MIVNGKQIASDILAEVKAGLQGRTPVVRAIVVQPTAATESYLSIKESRAREAGMELQVVRLPDDADEASVIAAVQEPGADAVIVQLPLPEHLYTETVLNAIPYAQDADVLSNGAYARFETNEEGALVPPVAGAVLEILTRSHVDVRGKQAVVVGRGKLVGKPVAVLLERLGALVTVVDQSTKNTKELLRDADIVVSGAGKANLIVPDVIKEGVVLIDAGTSGAYGGVLGDIHPDCASKASVYTPVPGGVGPVGVACLFKNAALLSEGRQVA